MNIALRKLAMLEKAMNEKEEQARIEGYVTSPVDIDMKNRIYVIMEKIRVV